MASLAAVVVVGARESRAVTGTWIGGVDPGGVSLPWEDPANWQDGIVPGSTAGAAGNSADVAYFNTPGGDGTIVAVDPNRNVGGITFDIASTGSGRGVGVSGGTNTLYMTDGSVIEVTGNTTTSTSPAINAPIVILGNSLTFLNNATVASSGLKPNGNVTTAATSGVTTIYLDGVNVSNTLTTNSQFAGSITDGPNSIISVVKNGTGVWDIRGADNTYSGQTILNAGGIRFGSGTGGMSPNSDYIVNGNSSLRASQPVTGKSITINTVNGYTASTQPLSVSGAGVFNLVTDSGPALTINVGSAVATADLALGVNMNLTGTVAGQGGIKVIGPAGWRVTLSRPIDLGTVERVFEVADTPDVSTDLRVTGAIVGTGGLTKTGAGTLKIETTAPSYTGVTTVKEGRLLLTSDTWGGILNSATGLTLAGGRTELDYATNMVSPYPDAVAALNAGRVRVSASPGVGANAEGVAIVDDAAGFTVTLARAFYGDTDLNGKLNADDYARVDRGMAMGLSGWQNGDVNYDGVVNSADYFLIDRAYGSGGVPHEAFAALLAQRAVEFGDGYVAQLVAAVPEPTSLGACGLAMIGLAGRGRRRR